ncbi:23S rRNA (adenine(2503)-C(2))-methyltransferase RlmN [Ruania rhizosphaerae]|uniref:23S rRNA (adenine(2503)-C(2))-methyltransferase RlmN n=1 Tax=Ruania rhizosphaerae TaxID=1840413 RepID=UPI00135B7F80|nr:23S rRNA (adenine(2503)-C(2))-methyltransferase RlmN [Ruania rhizosphaerae]
MTSQPQVLPHHDRGAGDRPQLSFAIPRRGKPPRHLADLSLAERSEVLREAGLPAYRAKQLSTHYFARLTRDPEAMTDIPADQRHELAELLLPELLTEHRRLEADGGTTVKMLWNLFDGVKVESVLMGYTGRTPRATLCVSSQAGCGMACPFCATGQQGLTRNLSTAEIIEQVRAAAVSCRDGEVPGVERLSNIVFMGMGEPLANYKAVIAAVQRMVEPAPEGLGLSARHITVSTVGLVPAIRKLTDLAIPVTLALSLHAPDDELRSQLVPINTRWSVGEALDAAKEYFDATGRRVSIEYALIKDMNDHAWRADLLASELLRRGRGWVHVNPIPLNPTPGSIWTASEKHVEDEFVARLRSAGIPATVRDTRGSDIDGACGQLAAQD